MKLTAIELEWVTSTLQIEAIKAREELTRAADMGYKETAQLYRKKAENLDSAVEKIIKTWVDAEE